MSFSLREYLAPRFTLPCGAVDETALNRALNRVGELATTTHQHERLKDIVAALGLMKG